MFYLYKQKGDTAITFKYMEERIPREADEVHFTRLSVHNGAILAPTSKEFVGSYHLWLMYRKLRALIGITICDL